MSGHARPPKGRAHPFPGEGVAQRREGGEPSAPARPPEGRDRPSLGEGVAPRREGGEPSAPARPPEGRDRPSLGEGVAQRREGGELNPVRPRCVQCRVAVALLVTGVAASFYYLGMPLGRMFEADAWRAMLAFAAGFFPPDLSPSYLARVGRAALETLAISLLGTVLAVFAAALLALPAAGRLGVGARVGARMLLNGLRSVPELVWAALMVLAAGIGPFAGVLALALHTAGVLGRLYAEALENAPPAPEASLVGAGSGAVTAFCYGTLPLVVAQWLAYALYRWEMNIRMAAILGFVGAGGLGTMLYYELSLFREAQASTVIIAMLLLSALVDTASQWLRADRPEGAR
ncbi:MAG: phosphonate ABC transporter, permease protein PhnE [Rhodocyclaceae bacterium]|nr:phosphonate ABC transporter, permease protein PhnE [Rhodocyclaceae bacterium]